MIRHFLNSLVLGLVLACVLVGAACVPAVQTWAARYELARRPGLHGSVGSVSAGMGSVTVADLHLEIDGAVLTAPAVEVRLPVVAALWRREAKVSRLAAKGWTLDLSGMPEADDANSPEITERAFLGVLSAWRLPGDVSLDEAELQGDILIPRPSGKGAVRVHVTIKGGGLAAGKTGLFALDAAGADVDSQFRAVTVAAHGRLAVAMESPRTVKSAGIRADFSASGGSLPAEIDGSAELAAVRDAAGENYSASLTEGGRDVAAVRADYSPTRGGLAGTWSVDLRNSDFASFLPDLSLPVAGATGEGRWDSDLAFSRLHVLGRLQGSTVGRVDDPAAASARRPATDSILEGPILWRSLGPVAFDASFDATRIGSAIRFGRLGVFLAASGRAAGATVVLKSLQPFSVDDVTGNVTAGNPRADWMEGSLRGLPLAALPPLPGGLSLAGGDAAVEVLIRTTDAGLALSSKAPLIAKGVSLQRDGATLVPGLDLSLALMATHAADGWQVQAAPLIVARAGRNLASVRAAVTGSGQGGSSIAASGTWDADMDALAEVRAARENRPAREERRGQDASSASEEWGRSASGDFTATFGDATHVEGKLSVLGHSPGHGLTASANVDIDADHAVDFYIPVTITMGSAVSDISADGKWSGGDAAPRLQLKLSGENAVLDQLRLLAAPLAGISDPREHAPFWGKTAGRVAVNFDRLDTGDHVFTDAAGTFDLEPGSIRLIGGRLGLPKKRVATAEGVLSFDAAAKFPYKLAAGAGGDDVAAAPFFPAEENGQDPGLEGKFSVATAFSGEGKNLADLAAFTRRTYRLTSTSTGGIFRLLRTTVADSIAQPARPVSDTLGTLGSAVGSLFGVKRGGDSKLDEVRLPKNTQAVIDLTYQVAEIGYDRAVVNAERGPDGTLRITAMELIAPEEHLVGFGRIGVGGEGDGAALSSQPLSVDLQLGVKGKVAGLFATAGLLSNRKDSQGYTLLARPIHFGGTLEHIDSSRWREILVEAARPPAASGK